MATAKNDPKKEPVYWFVVLQQALNRGNLQDAADAQRQLEALGVTVRFRRRPKHPPGEAAHVA